MQKESCLASGIKCPQNILVESTCLYLERNICEKHMLDAIAIQMGTNRSKLAASFKNVLGISVFEYLRKIRMEKAKVLLINSDISIQQISFEVGYENSANFSTSYKKYYQLSPREQRNIHINLKTVSSKHAGSINDEQCYEIQLISLY